MSGMQDYEVAMYMFLFFVFLLNSYILQKQLITSAYSESGKETAQHFGEYIKMNRLIPLLHVSARCATWNKKILV